MEPKKIKIKKISTGIVLTGTIDEKGNTVERYVRAGEEVTVWDWVLPKLDAIKEEYVVINENKAPGSFTDKKPTGDKS